MEQGDRDLLLELSGSDYQMNATVPKVGPAEPRKVASYSNLVQELFNVNPNTEEEMDLATDFENDSQSIESKQKSGQSPPQSSMQLLTVADAALDQQQKDSNGITSMACTLEFQRVQVTQQPQILCHTVRKGTTRESVPRLPGEVLPVTPAVPALPVFRLGSGKVQCQLETLDVEIVDEILSPLSSERSIITEEVPQQSVSDMSHSGSEDDGVGQLSLLENTELNAKVIIIRRIIQKFHEHGAPASSNGKVQVHEVVLVLLLAHQHGLEGHTNLGDILVFCTESGIDTHESSDNFMARDTKTMGLIWQKLKGNRNGNYDTFARAMRLGRERQKDYFAYLNTGKGTKKRIYKLGPKGLKELDRMCKVVQSTDF